MVSIIKNQILKHLSKFTKNLSPDQMNLSTFKGEGELRDLDLNEEVLMDLLELPNWLRLTKAICNKVSIKVQWTKLKSVPIFINLDEVLVEMETCDELRQTSSHNSTPSYNSGGKYGFPDMVIDGISVSINNVEIKFSSPAFQASFQFSRIRLESRNPNWQSGDLRMTRLKDSEAGQLLIFKELEWQMLRIEAAATDRASEFTSPLRLITNQAKCRITIKKRLIDCSILASRLFFILDDLLWILTDTQIKAALHFLSSLSGLIERSTEINKRIKAAHKVEVIAMSNRSQMPKHLAANCSRTESNQSPLAFSAYDIIETSFHVYSSLIDLHFCDEADPGEGRSNHALLSDGGAMQVTLAELAFDYYPYHLPSSGRKHWMSYGDLNTSCKIWIEQLMAAYKQQLVDLVLGEVPKKSHSVHRHSVHSYDERRRGSTGGQSKAAVVTTFLRRLMSSCVVLRLGDFSVFQVTTTATKRKVPDKFFASDKNRLMLPSNLPTVHVEFVDYYFPGDEDFPVPLSNVHVHLNPIQMIVEPITILWLNAFASGLRRSQECYRSSLESTRPLDMRIEALMLRMVVEETREHVNQPSRPRSVQVHISRLIATNSRIEDNCGREDLGNCLTSFQEGSLFSATAGFPNKTDDLQPLSRVFGLHVKCEDDDESISTSPNKSGNSIPKADSSSTLSRDMLWTENKSTWCVHMEPVWADFCSSYSSSKCRPRVPFVDAVQVSLWVARDTSRQTTNEDADESSSGVTEVEGPASTHILAQFKSLVSVQLNHYQYVFLLRCSEQITELADNLAADSCDELNRPASRLCVAAIVPEVDVSFLIPVNSPLKNDTVDAETVSIRDDLSSSTANTAGGGGGGGGGRGGIDRLQVIGSTGNLDAISRDHRRSMHHLRESISDNRIAQMDNGNNNLDRVFTSTCSDYAINDVGHAGHPSSSAIPDGRSFTGSRERVEEEMFRRRKQHSPMRAAINIPLANNVPPSSSSAKPSNGARQNLLERTGQLPGSHALAGIFGKQVPSMSIDGFTNPYPSKKTSFDKVPDNLGQTLAIGSNAMKKGVSSLVASLDSSTLLNANSSKAATPLTSPLSFHDSHGHGGSGSNTGASSRTAEDVETLSLCSDLSDSENFAFLNADDLFPGENVFRPHVGDQSASVEVAREVFVEEDFGSDKSNSDIFKPHDLVKIVVFKMGNVELIQESKASTNSLCKIRVRHLSCEEGGTMSADEFQAKFSAGSRTWKAEAIKYTLPTSDVNVRFQRGPDIGHVCTEAIDRGFLEARIGDLDLHLLTGSVANLKDLLEDEIAPSAVPMNLTISNLHLHLRECHSSSSSSSSSSEVTSTDPIPLVIDVHELMVSRTPDGVIHVLPVDAISLAKQEEHTIQVERLPKVFRIQGFEESVSAARVWARRSSLENLEEKVFQLQEENEQLRLKLISMETRLQQQQQQQCHQETRP